MDTREVKVACPCCNSWLEVDVRTGTVLRWRKKDGPDNPGSSEGDWGAASERVSRRMGSATEKFDESLTREKKRAQDLDELFRKTNERLGRRDDKDEG